MTVLETLMAPQTKQGRQLLVHGLVTAKVTTRQADGTYLLNYLTMGAGEASAPARVMMPMAANKSGTYFFPKTGDEVVVAFESGDTSFPVILGAVWNQDNSVPDQAQASTENVGTIVSRSGHEVTLDDSPGAGKVTIKTNGGHSLVLDDTPPGSVTLKTTMGSQLIMDDTPPGKVTLSTPIGTSVSLDNVGNLTLSAPVSISLQTPGLVSIQAALGIALTSSPATPIALTTNSLPYLSGSLVVIQ